MVYVQLQKSWNDQQGKAHAPGAMVDVDAATLAQLQATGVVEEPGANGGSREENDPDWVGPSSEDPNEENDPDWVGPSSEDPDE